MSSRTTTQKQKTARRGLVAMLLQISDRKKRIHFLRNRHRFNERTVLQLNRATQEELPVSRENALSLAEAAVVLSRKLRKADLLGQSYRIKANVLAAEGDYPAAVRDYEQAFGLFEEIKDEEGMARTLTAAIQPYIMLGAYDRAFQSAERAQEIFAKLGDQRRLARLQNNIGNIYHRQDRFEEALAHYERAYNELLPHGDAEELGIALNNISMCLISLNDFVRALATYERAKERLKEKDLPWIRLITDYNIAYLYYMCGRYRQAIQILTDARSAGEKIGYAYIVALCHLDLSDIYVELNLTTEALEAAEAGHRSFEELQIGYESAKSITNRAIAFQQKGRSRQALELFDQAKELFVREKNAVWPWLIDLYKAVVLFQSGRLQEARALATGVVPFSDASPLKNKAALCHLVLSRVALQSGEMVDARKECFRSLELLETLEAPILHYEAHSLLGEIEHAEGNLSAAYDRYQLARRELESLRGSLDRDELKISFMKNKSGLYERLVEICLDETFNGHSRSEAFAYMELAKSRTFTEMLARRPNGVSQEKKESKDLTEKVHRLREELNWYQHRMELEQLRPETYSSERLKQLKQEAQAREKSLMKALAERPEAGSDSAPDLSPPQVSLNQLQALCGEEVTLLEYFFVGDAILAAVVTKDTLDIRRAGTVSKVAQTLRLLRFQLEKAQAAVADEKQSSAEIDLPTLTHLQELYAELFAPLRNQLNKTHLVIVPHGFLHYLPFHALHDGEGFLLDFFTISYAPSSSLFALCQLPQENHAVGSLILGAPDARSPLIQDEVEAVHEILPASELYAGQEASRSRFWDKAPGRRLVHIAAHGLFRPDNPMFSGVRLNDDYVYLYEFYERRLSTSLITVSGCATGLNVVVTGDELLGLTRGLMYAGARSLVLSLWNVNDRSTTSLMKSFYRQLTHSWNIAGALRAAAKEVREEYPHPYHWAPFFLVGKAVMSGGREVLQ